MEDAFEGDKTGGSSPGERCGGPNRGIGSRDGEERLDLKINETIDWRIFLLHM